MNYAISGIGVLLGVLFYCGMAYPLYGISKKLRAGNPVWAWVPMLNFLLMCDIAEQSRWFAFSFLIPYVNLITILFIHSRMAIRCNRNPWTVILLLVPLIQIGFYFYVMDGIEAKRSLVTNKPS